MFRRAPLLAALAAAAAVLSAPSAAFALTGTTNQRCYSHVPTQGTQPIVVTLRGGVPGANFEVVASDPGAGWGSAGGAEGTYDAAGNAVAQIANVFPPGGSIKPMRGKNVHLSVRTYAPTGIFETQLEDVLITNFTVTVASKPIKPRRRRKVTVSGTPFAHKTVYGFVVKGKNKHVLHRFKLGKGNLCGYVRHKVKVAPRHYHTGRYRLYLNAGKHLHRKRALRYDFRIYHRYY
jgi:hypothetical protein